MAVRNSNLIGDKMVYACFSLIPCQSKISVTFTVLSIFYLQYASIFMCSSQGKIGKMYMTHICLCFYSIREIASERGVPATRRSTYTSPL